MLTSVSHEFGVAGGGRATPGHVWDPPILQAVFWQRRNSTNRTNVKGGQRRLRTSYGDEAGFLHRFGIENRSSAQKQQLIVSSS